MIELGRKPRDFYRHSGSSACPHSSEGTGKGQVTGWNTACCPAPRKSAPHAGYPRQANRSHAGDSAPDWPLPARPLPTRKRWAKKPSRSIATWIEADDGTRTASVAGAFVAMALSDEAPRRRRACCALRRSSTVSPPTSVGILDDVSLLDLLRGRLPAEDGHEHGRDREPRFRRNSSRRRGPSVHWWESRSSGAGGGQRSPLERGAAHAASEVPRKM